MSEPSLNAMLEWLRLTRLETCGLSAQDKLMFDAIRAALVEWARLEELCAKTEVDLFSEALERARVEQELAELKVKVKEWPKQAGVLLEALGEDEPYPSKILDAMDFLATIRDFGEEGKK